MAEARPLYAHAFRASIPEIRRVLLAVERRLVPAGPDLANRIELVLAELLSNIQRHGGMKGPARVTLKVFWQARGLVAEVIDDGCAVPLDCLSSPHAPEPSSLPESGFGWSLIHLLVTDLHYRRDEGHNIVHFTVPP